MPSMPTLPEIRVKEARPFMRTGLDYLGPLYIKTSDNSKKVWICLFTKDVNECSNIRIFVFRSNIRIRFLNSNICFFLSVPALYFFLAFK